MEKNEEKDDNLEVAKQLINAVRQQFEEENKELIKYRNEYYKTNDFTLSRFYPYNGPNFYLDRRALVFNIYIAPAGDSVEYFRQEVVKLLPKIAQIETPYMIDLFCEALLQVMKMDIDLYINKYSISTDGDDYVVAIEFLDKRVAKEAALLVSEWFRSIAANKEFDFQPKFLKLQAAFDKTLYGGPTIYSLVEAGFQIEYSRFLSF